MTQARVSKLAKYKMAGIWIPGLLFIDLIGAIGNVAKGNQFHMCSLCFCKECQGAYILGAIIVGVFFIYGWILEQRSKRARDVNS